MDNPGSIPGRRNIILIFSSLFGDFSKEMVTKSAHEVMKMSAQFKFSQKCSKLSQNEFSSLINYHKSPKTIIFKTFMKIESQNERFLQFLVVLQQKYSQKVPKEWWKCQSKPEFFQKCSKISQNRFLSPKNHHKPPKTIIFQNVMKFDPQNERF